MLYQSDDGLVPFKFRQVIDLKERDCLANTSLLGLIWLVVTPWSIYSCLCILKILWNGHPILAGATSLVDHNVFCRSRFTNLMFMFSYCCMKILKLPGVLHRWLDIMFSSESYLRVKWLRKGIRQDSKKELYNCTQREPHPTHAIHSKPT